ncbi:hypothetical protein BDZ45DRAFT_677306 [Acephala macrosclerotiorum]|nr:hypothetical protein BDZ45DRAFT_677306 [Acephala macrosclerotiorum]
MENSQVTLAKACEGCIKAKRKCSRTLPQCQRCTAKHLTCKYKNQPGFSGDLSSSGNSSLISANISREIRPLHNNNGDQLSFEIPVTLSLDHIVLEAPKLVLPMGPCTVHYLKSRLLRFPQTFVRTGGTLFIHERLFQTKCRFPEPLSSTFILCAIHSQLTPHNSDLIADAIRNTTTMILNSIAKTHTFISQLASFQSLILLQILTLLSQIPSHPELHTAAVARLPLLRAQIHKMYNLAPTSLPSSMSPYHAWILGESLRRSLHIGHMILGVHSVMTSGTFTLSLFVEALPLDRNGGMWDDVWAPTRGQGWVEGIGRGKENVGTSMRADLISYRELTDAWDRGEMKKPTLFEEMLIAACKGIENVKLT